MAQRPRLLVFDSFDSQTGAQVQQRWPDHEIVRAESLVDGLALLQAEEFDGVYINPLQTALWEKASSFFQSHYILQVLDDGVALVTPDLHITWANSAFEEFCGGKSRRANVL